MNRKREWRDVPAIVAAALGMDFVSGRAVAAFYAQTGRTSWAGICLSALLFGLTIGVLVYLARRSGAQNMIELFKRMPGGGAGKCAYALYTFVVLLAVGMLAASAGHAGALVLPVHRAEVLGGVLALVCAAALVFAGGSAIRTLGTGLVLMLLVFELMLLFFGKMPVTPQYAVEMQLRGNWTATGLFSLLHASVCLWLCAGIALRFCGGRIRPARMGTLSGGLYALVLAVGNGVLRQHDEWILALKVPFVALSSGWGDAGFYLSAILGWLFCMFSLAGLFCGILPLQRGRIFTENDVKL